MTAMRWIRGTRWAVAASALALGVGALLPASSVVASTSALGFHGAHGAHGGGGGSSLLIDHGGPILPTSDVYAIFWGPTSAWSGEADATTGMTDFFNHLGGSSLANIAVQYMRGLTLSVGVNFKGVTTDTSNPPSKVQPSTLGTEVQHLFPSASDPNALYFVFTSNFPRGGNFCAWHSYAAVNGQNVAVAYMPNLSGVSGCSVTAVAGNDFSATTQALANVTSHEFMEAITDTLPSSSTYGWIDSSGSEIGDKCAWQFSAPVTLGTTSWPLQEEWSNSANGCVQQA
jgi:hypothetical protein